MLYSRIERLKRGSVRRGAVYGSMEETVFLGSDGITGERTSFRERAASEQAIVMLGWRSIYLSGKK